VPESVRSRAVAAVLAVVLVGSVLGLGIAAAGNTASWSGQISINATPADDGSSYQYEINDLDAADNFDINVTGHTATEWDNVSGSNLADGDSLSVDVAGNAEPTGPSSSGEPVVEFSGVSQDKYNAVNAEGDGDANAKIAFIGDNSLDQALTSSAQIQPDTDQISILKPSFDGASGSDYGFSVDIRIASGGADTSYGEGTLVKSGWSPDFSSGRQTINLDTTYDVTPGNTYEIEFITQSKDSDGTDDFLQIDTDDSASTTWLETEFSKSQYADIDAIAREKTDSPAVDIDGDGSDEVSYSGTLSSGETVTKEISSLSTSDDSFDISTTNGGVNVAVKLKERTKTVDPSIEVNGETTSYTGTLADGSTETLSTDTNWLVDGTNRINVSVGDGTLSADAPSPKVELEYSHQAQDEQFVTYEAEKFTERYNISKTYASDRDTADVSVSFVQNVVSVRDVEISRNNSAWSTVPTKDYSLDSNTLTVDLGSTDKDETVGLKINGSRVDVNNGSVSVQRVSKFADELNSSIRVDSWNSDSYLDVTQADDGDELMFLADAEWTASEHNIYAQGGTHELHLPDAGAGQTADIRSVPITVGTNDNRARLSVTNTSSAEPAFQVRPAGDGSTAVTFTHEEAVDGTDYILWSQTDEIVRDSGTASSPLSLEDDDSEETLKFRVDDGGSSSSSGGGSAGITAGPISVGSDSSPLNSVPAVLLAWALVEVLLFVVDRRAFGSAVSIPNPVPGVVPVVGGSGWTVELPGGRGPLFYVGSLVSSLFVLEFLSGGEISGGIRGILEELGSSVGGVIAQVGPAIALIAVLGIAWIIYQRVRPRPIEVGGDDEE
jgi:hypothetical protein